MKLQLILLGMAMVLSGFQTVTGGAAFSRLRVLYSGLFAAREV